MLRFSRVILLASFFAALPSLQAQVHEEQPVDLAKGLIVRQASAEAGAKLATPEKTGVGQLSFAASALVDIPAAATETSLLSQGDSAQGWRLFATADGALRFEARAKDRPEPVSVGTPAGVIMTGSAHHVAINIQRDATKPNAGIWLDGVELASGVVPPVNLSAPLPFTTSVTAKQVHLYHRDLNRTELLALQLDALTDGKPKPKHPAPPAGGPRFVPQPNETIALIGGTEAVALAESGELEALLLASFPETRFRFRCLAWEGDTVFHQDRPLNFGDLAQQLRRVNAGTVFVMFGRQECLDRGKEGIGEFKDRLSALLGAVAQATPNIVVIGPAGFEQRPAPMPDVTTKNHDLESYAQGMRSVADAKGVRFVSALPRADVKDSNSDELRADGVTLSPTGCQRWAARIAVELTIPEVAIAKRGEGNTPIQPGDIDHLLQQATTPALPPSLIASLRAKNRLWHDYWRPTNWAFLHGDRTQQPSSRDHVNPQLRFFPSEQEKYLPLIKDAEEKIYKLVEETTKKLP